MPATYEPIASTTLGSNASEINFTSISGNFSDLVIVASGTTTSIEDLYCRFNGDTATNYSRTFLSGDGSSATSGRASSQSLLNLSNYGYFGTTNPNIYTVQIMSYASTNVFKTVLITASNADNGVSRLVGLWRSTSAITSIRLYTPTHNMKTGMTASLFGVKAA